MRHVAINLASIQGRPELGILGQRHAFGHLGDFQLCFARELIACSFQGLPESMTADGSWRQPCGVLSPEAFHLPSKTHRRTELIGGHFLRRRSACDLGGPIRPNETLQDAIVIGFTLLIPSFSHSKRSGGRKRNTTARS